METPTQRPASSEEIFDLAINRGRDGSRFSLARLVIILYITGLFAAMFAASMPSDREQPPSPASFTGSPNSG